MKCVLLLVIYVAITYGVSDSDPKYVTVCDATSPLWGCDPQFWDNDDRLLCMNTTNIMNWATRPIRSNCYEIFEETRTTSYTPSELVTLTVLVKCLKMNFRGILIYAVDENNNRVGDWEITGEEPPLYKRPWADKANPCFGSLMHASAQNKPYVTRIYWKAPAAGTGTVTFRCLIKVKRYKIPV
jgi:hypothetical protein